MWSPHFYFRTTAAHGAYSADYRQRLKNRRRQQENDVNEDELSGRRDSQPYLISSVRPSLYSASELAAMAYEQSRQMEWNGLHVFGMSSDDEVSNSASAGIPAAVLRRCIQDGLPQVRPSAIKGSKNSVNVRKTWWKL